MMKQFKKVLVAGGGGYVGAVLVPKLLAAGYEVNVIDLFIYGEEVLDGVKDHPNLRLIKADLRDIDLVKKSLEGCDAIIHLACISNDPSFELNPDLGKEINFDCFEPLVIAAKEAGVKRFVYASSSSVYGISEVPDVDENHELKPLTDYSKFKALCEEILLKYQGPDFVPLILRPATVCGYSPRQRMDLIVNILTNHAYNNNKIKVFGGAQLRPNIHIEDMTDLYVKSLELEDEKVAGKRFNAGYQNHSVSDIADIVRDVVSHKKSGEKIDVVTTPSDDNRSYHISSRKIQTELGFIPKRTIEDAIRDVVVALDSGKLPGSMEDEKYFNIKMMQKIDLK